jgi:hypothetical protein
MTTGGRTAQIVTSALLSKHQRIGLEASASHKTARPGPEVTPLDQKPTATANS